MNTFFLNPENTTILFFFGQTNKMPGDNQLHIPFLQKK